MVGLKEFCVMLLAGGMGAGSVVAVQEVKPRIAKARSAPKATPAAVRPASARPALGQGSGEGSSIDDCPIYAPLPGSVLANLGMAPNQQTEIGRSFVPSVGPGPLTVVGPGPGPGGGGGVDPFPPPGGGGTPGIIPEPAAWAMMVSGFGLVGLALRRSDGPLESQALGDGA